MSSLNDNFSLWLKQKRVKEMETSPQLTLGKIIELLQKCDQEKIVRFDKKNLYPSYFTSWRGSYCELSLTYAEQPVTVKMLLRNAISVVGKYQTGYKGGEFLMTRDTPVWIANYGMSSGFKKAKDKQEQYIVDIVEESDYVIIKTVAADY